MSLLDLLRADGFITVNKFLAKKIGLHETIFLAEIISWYKYYSDRNELDREEMFFCTVEKMEDNTTLTAHQQRACIKSLSEHGLIISKQKGLPAKRYFKINEQALEDFIYNKKLKNLTSDKINGSDGSKGEKPRYDQELKNLTTRGLNNEQLEVKKVDGINTLFNNNNLKKDDDDRLDISFQIFDIFKDKITPEEFQIIFERVVKEDPSNFRKYLETAVINEIKKNESKKKVSEILEVTSKPNRSGSSRKPKIEMVKIESDETEVSNDELSAMLAKAKLLSGAARGQSEECEDERLF